MRKHGTRRSRRRTRRHLALAATSHAWRAGGEAPPPSWATRPLMLVGTSMEQALRHAEFSLSWSSCRCCCCRSTRSMPWKWLRCPPFISILGVSGSGSSPSRRSGT
eukprot:175577-Chlamydomonas_euryale.AAC.1